VTTPVTDEAARHASFEALAELRPAARLPTG
jgi:hypothetical protein